MLVIAERFGVLPDDVETRMSEYYFNQVVLLMEAESINHKKRDAEHRRAMKRGRR